MNEMDKLIKKLDEFFSDPNNFDEEGYASDADFDYSDSVGPYSTLVVDNVCVPQGRINYMSDRGYEVVCLVRDSFGWLMGGISKVCSDGKRRMLTFG